MFRIGYAHPRVEAIVLWGFWANRIWLGPESAIVNADWSLNAAGERLSKLLLEEWRTTATVSTNEHGVVAFRGFYGSYELELVDEDGRAHSGSCALTPDSKSATVRLRQLAH
jgi:hypothetical protein